MARQTTRLHIVKKKDIIFASFTAQDMWKIELERRAYKEYTKTPEYIEKRRLADIEEDRRLAERRLEKQKTEESQKHAIVYVLTQWFDNDGDD